MDTWGNGLGREVLDSGDMNQCLAWQCLFLSKYRYGMT